MHVFDTFTHQDDYDYDYDYDVVVLCFWQANKKFTTGRKLPDTRRHRRPPACIVIIGCAGGVPSEQ